VEKVKVMIRGYLYSQVLVGVAPGCVVCLSLADIGGCQRSVQRKINLDYTDLHADKANDGASEVNLGTI
jgi:hypothetical protein